MSQNDFNIANQGFPSFRSDLNDALQALASNSSGATEPATTYAGQFWYDSTNDVLKFRNEANSAWIDPPIAGLVQALSDLGVTASAAELNKMDGVTASTAELNYVDGVTSNIQTQLDAKGVGDITGVTAGTNLTGGGTSGDVTVNLTASPNITSLSVGSSEVIGSSRQLKNIASVDAATAAAITAAGVGGLTTLVADNVSPLPSDNPIIGPISLEDHLSQTFTFYLKSNGGSTGRIQMRLYDDSGSVITSDYQYTTRSSGTFHDTGSNDRIIFWGKEPLNNNTGDYLKFEVTFTDAYSSTVATGIKWSTTLRNTLSTSTSGSGYGSAGHEVTQRNQSFILYFENGTNWNASSTYSSWGVS